LEARGEWRKAATAWQQASQTTEGEVSLGLQLNAADALLNDGDGLGAAQIARALPTSIPPALNLRRALILADASVQAGDPVRALQHLGTQFPATPRAVLARYRRIRADALEMSDDAMGASRERSLRDSALDSNEQRYRNRQRLWTLLSVVSTEQLQAPLALPPSAHDGWVELARIVRQNALDVDQLSRAVNDWSVRYPGHPAGEEIVPEVIEIARTEAQPPGKVALLLPQTGPFASVATAIREGFMAAWHADAPNQHRPEIIMLDTHAQDAAFVYSNAINDGAQFIVGPLTKESVTAVLDGATVDVTTLVLNYPLAAPISSDQDGVDKTHQSTAEKENIDVPAASSHTNSVANSATTIAVQPAESVLSVDAQDDDAVSRARNLQRVFYFVLSPEDEARQAAEYAFEHGARQAAVLSAQGVWGDRVSEAFAQHWQSLGGIITTHVRYSEEAHGLSEAVEQLLNIGNSKARAKQLRSVLVRSITHEPQPRSDSDVIFLAAFPQAARQIRPLLRFHRAENMPVLATSHVYEGFANPQADQDLDGVMFADMPWLLTPDAHSLPTQVRNLWPDASGALGRLYAFGADAYTLIARLRELRVSDNSSYPGLTGKLSVDAQHSVRRGLLWTRFTKGVAQATATTDDVLPVATWAVSGR
jgi:outer membrane PBP1 activator LpoA protein